MHCSLPSKVLGMIAVILVGNFALCLGTDTLEADFASIDTDGDGFLTKEEILLAMKPKEDPEAPKIEDAADHFCTFLDLDKDGKISLEEFISPRPDTEEMTEPEDLSYSSIVDAADFAVDAEGSVSAAAAATVGASSVSRGGRRKRRKFSKKSKKKAQKAIVYALSSTCKPDSLGERPCKPSNLPCNCGHGWVSIKVRPSCTGQSCLYLPDMWVCRRDCTDNPYLRTLCNTPLFGQQYCCKNKDICNAKTWGEVKSYLKLHANAFNMLYGLGKTGAKTFKKALLKYTRKRAKKEMKEAKKELINLVKNSVMETMKSELNAEVGIFVDSLNLPLSVPGLDESDMGSQLFQDAMAGLEMERMVENEDASNGYFDSFVEEGREILEGAFMDFIDPIGFKEEYEKHNEQLCSEGRAIWNDVDIGFEPGESILSRGTILSTAADTWEWKTSSPAHVVKVLFKATNSTQTSWEYARFAFSAMMFYNGNLVWSQFGLKPDHIAIPTAYPLLLEHGYFSPEVPQGVKVDHIKIISPNTNILSIDVLTWGIEEIDDGVENPHAPDKSVIVVCKGSTDVFDVNLSSTTVKDLKAKIAVWLESEGDNIQHFHLIHTYYEKGQTFTRELQNDMDTLSKYNIEYSDTIELQDKRTKCKVHVRLSQYYTSTVDVFLSSTTVGELKSKSMATGRRLMISRYYGYARKIYLDDDNRTLHSYGVEPNEEIFAFDP